MADFVLFAIVGVVAMMLFWAGFHDGSGEKTPKNRKIAFRSGETLSPPDYVKKNSDGRPEPVQPFGVPK